MAELEGTGIAARRVELAQRLADAEEIDRVQSRL
jgi:hypothetical protein